MFKKKSFSRSKLKKVRSPHAKKRILKIFGFFLAVVLVAAAIFLLTNNPFQINKIGFVTPTYCVPNTELTSFVSSNSKNYFLTDFQGVENKILERYPCLKSANIKKVFPNKLELSLAPRERVAQVTIYNSNITQRLRDLEATSSSNTPKVDLAPKVDQATESGVFAADLDGYVFEKEFDPSILNIKIFDENISSGHQIEGNVIKKTVESLNKVSEMGIPVRGVSIRDNSLYIDSEPSINLSLEKDLPRQLISLQLILQKAKIESELKVRKIDLRFDKAVVEYSP